MSTLEGEEVCPAQYGLDAWHDVGIGIGVTTFGLVRDNVVAWNGEPLGPAPLPPCNDVGQFASAMGAVTAECCDEPSEVRSAFTSQHLYFLKSADRPGGNRSATQASQRLATLCENYEFCI